MVEFLIKKGVNPDSELTPNSGGAAAVESEQSKRKCVTFNKEENFSTDIMPSCSAVRPPRQLKSVLKESFRINRASRRLKDQISISEGTMTREPEQRKKKCVTFNNEVHYNTDQKPFCSRVRPPGELKSILKKSIQISGDNGRNKDQLSLWLSENPHVPASTTEDKAGTSVVKIIQKKFLYSKKMAAMKQRDQAELCQSVKDIRFLRHFLSTEALPEYPRKKTCLLVENKKGEDFLPPPYMHDIVPQPPAHADATSTCHVSNRGDSLHASEETTVNTTTADPTPSLGDVLNPTQNCNMRVLASSPPEHTRYAVNTPSTIFLIWAIFTSLLLLTTLIWVVKFVTLEMPWVMDLI
ncbi:uncharacterized protein LOC119799853 [Arvicola amphibius]|uniref:uncharacterized protein LOC119799853 n=1 Tax=Arvicola amphibius TaxID=1047088 RepID=UPI001C0A0BDE|nr:uncharacterized protein LOC119799853 [Arvicola amphibius]